MIKLVPLLFAIVLLDSVLAGCGTGGDQANVTVQRSSTTTVADSTAASTGTSNQSGQDNRYLLTSGHVADMTDKREITALVKRYYVAAAADDGATACSLLSPSLAESAVRDYGNRARRRYLHGNTCRAVLSRLFKHPPDVSAAELSTTRVIGVRLSNSRHGFALISSKGMPLGEVNVVRVGNAWRVGVLIGSVN